MSKKDKKEEEIEIISKPGSNPENKFKENVKPVSTDVINNIIKSPVENAKAKSGDSLYDEGTNVDYNEEK